MVGAGNALTCFSHTLQLIVTAGNEVPVSKTSIDRVRNLIKFVRSHRHVLEAVFTAKKELGGGAKRARS